MSVTHDCRGRDKVDIKALGLLIAMYQKRSSRVLQNNTEIFIGPFLEAIGLQEISLFSNVSFRAMTWFQLISGDPN